MCFQKGQPLKINIIIWFQCSILILSFCVYKTLQMRGLEHGIYISSCSLRQLLISRCRTTLCLYCLSSKAFFCYNNYLLIFPQKYVSKNYLKQFEEKAIRNVTKPHKSFRSPRGVNVQVVVVVMFRFWW